MQLWAETTRQELEDATGDRREPQHPAAPRLERETASPETAHACFRTAQRLFRDAASRGVVSHQIWTLTASDRPRLPKRQITTNTIYSPTQIESITDTLSQYQRHSRDAHGAAVTVKGDRYVACVMCEAVLGPRPGELQAVRRSWVNLNNPEPHIVWRETVKYASKANSGSDTSRTVGALKHRDETVLRIQRIPTLLVPLLQRHLGTHVAQGTGDDLDPLIFTTHNQTPVHRQLSGDFWGGVLPLRVSWLPHLLFRRRLAGSS